MECGITTDACRNSHLAVYLLVYRALANGSLYFLAQTVAQPFGSDQTLI